MKIVYKDEREVSREGQVSLETYESANIFKVRSKKKLSDLRKRDL